MSSTLLRYVSRLFLARALGAMIGLAMLVQLIDLLDNATDILDRRLGAAGMLHYIGLRLPSILNQVVVLGVLIGILITVGQLARRNEIVILRACGVTIYRLGLVLLPVLILIGLAQFFLADRLVPASQHALAVWWEETTPLDQRDEGRDAWFRLRDQTIGIGGSSDGGRRLTDLRIYLREEDGRLTGRIAAPLATFEDEHWHLSQAVETTIEGDRATIAPPRDRLWDTSLRPRDVFDLSNRGLTLSSQTLHGILAGERAANQSPGFYRTRLYQTYAAPWGSFIMVAIGLGIARGGTRQGGNAKLVLSALGLGLLFLLSNGILGAFGIAGKLPPLLAAWAALPVFACLTVAVLIRREEP